MSSFKCEQCGTDNIDTEDGYVQECTCVDELINGPTTEQIRETHNLYTQFYADRHMDSPEEHRHKTLLIKRLAEAEANLHTQKVLAMNWEGSARVNEGLKKEAQAKLDAVRECDVITLHRAMGSGRYMYAKDVLKIIGEQE